MQAQAIFRILLIEAFYSVFQIQEKDVDLVEGGSGSPANVLGRPRELDGGAPLDLGDDGLLPTRQSEN